MSETRVLLGKITALRQRLEQAQGLAGEARSAATQLLAEAAAGTLHDLQVDHVVRPLTGEAAPQPRPLTARARHALERGRDLLARLRSLADAFALDGETAPPGGDVVLLERGEPLTVLYRETAAMTDAAQRMMLQLPDAASAQMRLCEGLEAVLGVVAVRLQTLTVCVARHRQETGQVARLARSLAALSAGEPLDVRPFAALAEELLTEADEHGPLRLLEGDVRRPAHFVACHSLNVARVVARVVRHEPDLRSRPLEAILAALLHDVGMLRVPPETLAQPRPLTDDECRAVESHCRHGSDLVAALVPDAPWLAQVALGHHERLDGTGYPDGLHAYQLPPLTRLLAVCDVYAAQCAARPHRGAPGTRAALADTLLLAEQGLLDRNHAERLLHLGFYPVGSAVELADGAVGVVAAAPDPRDLSSPGRPVVILLLDAQGTPLAPPRHLDLARCDHHSVVRALSAAERRGVLGVRFPEWA
ncbi:MAG TPA: HD domain-containing phosphohydrolase [Gemmataceae bacterium]|nr:HD domain-containing phosphohydrolase [Gemmataceae bacterium]